MLRSLMDPYSVRRLRTECALVSSLKSNQVARPTSGKPGILVVDDELLIRNLLKQALERQGFTVYLAADGHEATQWYRRCYRDIRVVFLEVYLPGLDGPHTLTALRKINPQIHCCLITGYTGRYTEQELYEEYGAASLLSKPFRLAEIMAIVGQLTGSLEPCPAAH